MFFAGMVLNFFIKNVIDKVGFGPVDHVLGIVFGAARGVIAVTVLLMFLAVSPLKSHQWYNESRKLHCGYCCLVLPLACWWVWVC